MSGTLHVVGMGPGDPELMTLKAARILASAPVFAHFAKIGRAGHARNISQGKTAPDATELRFDYPYTTEIDLADPRYLAGMGEFYEQCAQTVAKHLQAGRDVALLCEGDPFFYGSAMYVFDRLRESHPTEVIPGVTAMSGAWSRCSVPMTHGDDRLTVLPGTLQEDELAERLADADAAVIMKIGRNLPKIRAALERAGLCERAIYVERATMRDELVCKVADLDRAPAPYFALILVPGRQGAR